VSYTTSENDSDEILTLESRSNYVTTVCDHAKESRSVFAGQVVRLDQSLECPLRRHGSRWTGSRLSEDMRSTELINRFGNYTVNFSRTPEPLPSNLREPAGTESLGQASFDHTSSVG
jgi:hypothetical protein